MGQMQRNRLTSQFLALMKKTTYEDWSSITEWGNERLNSIGFSGIRSVENILNEIEKKDKKLSAKLKKMVGIWPADSFVSFYVHIIKGNNK